MADTLPFVGRQSERETLQELITASSEVGLCPVVAQSGYGKSDLLQEIQQQYDTEEVAQFFYQIKEPKNADQFFHRVLEEWEQTFPKSRLKQLQNVLLPNLLSRVGDILGRNGPDPVTRGAGAVVGATGDALGEGDGEVQDIAVRLVKLAKLALERSEADSMVLLFDQFDLDDLSEEVRVELGRIFRTVGQLLPESILCCVGTKHRFYRETENYVSEIELSEFSQSEVREYVSEAGFDTDLAETVYRETSGHPYYVTRLLQIARNKNSLKAGLDNLPNLRRERYKRLEERFLRTLEPEERDILEETAVLQELRPEVVAVLVDEPESAVRSVLDSLHERAILKRRGFHDGTPVYQRHELQQQHLRESISESELANQHRVVAAVYAKRMTETLPTTTPEFFTPAGDSNSREFIAAGALFEYHLHQLPPSQPLDEHLDQIITSVSEVDDQTVRQVITEYFRNVDDTITDTEVFNIEAEYDTKEIVEAVKINRPSSRSLPSAEQLYTLLQDDETLTDAQAGFAALIYDTYVAGMHLSDTQEEIIKLVRERLNYLSSSDVPSEVEDLARLGRMLCIWWLDTVAKADMDFSFWPSLKSEYDFTQDDWEKLWDTVMGSFTLIESDFGFAEMGEHLHVERDEDSKEVQQKRKETIRAQIAEHGIYGGLTEAAGGPIVMMTKQANNLKTGDDVAPYLEAWTELKQHFTDTNHPALAALCQDVIEYVLLPLSNSSTPGIAIIKVTRKFELNDTNAIDNEPIGQLVTMAQAIKRAIRTYQDKESD